MKTPSDYLDDLKTKFGSDYESAKQLKTQQATISSIRRRGQMSDETAIKIADLLGIDRDEILISAAIARNEGAAKAAWIEHARKVGIAAAITLAAVNIGELELITDSNTYNYSSDDFVYYVKYY